ncbi:Hsp33 family molecular chaperone HslO [Cellvibrio sp. PSBB006]|uniref:Hsp33 family molecular chaperone HslO n=1 Tax=Cellvibrio sp. PSBB006 TaxID=1987723 RepID=UPI000B3B9368|nr:Hsp33 family molecular chaperone HslO [Cellvibrio sp. PSBB006]ARU28655.1 Hsp33 family molecular chaperone [Cellvibrio sp. PSBB006]
MTPSNDLLHRFMFDEYDIRGDIVTLGDSYREVMRNNPYAASVKNLLGEFLAAASLLSSTLKFDGMIILQARGNGPISTIMAECSNHKNLRGIVRLNPEQVLTETQQQTADMHTLLGEGVLAITIEPKRGERYQGIVPMDSDTLAGCLEHYFQQSEQLETRLWFAANGEYASGLLLQALPRQVNTSPEENEDQWETLSALAGTLSTDELLNLDHASLLYRLFHEHQVRLFDPSRLNFSCSCSRERTGNALVSIGREEVETLLAENGHVDVDCQFCNQHYHFDAAEVRALFGDATLH